MTLSAWRGAGDSDILRRVGAARLARGAFAWGWVSSRAVRPYLLLTGASLLVSVYLNWHLLGGFGHRMIAGNPGDIRLFMWYLAHDPWSLRHGRDPFFFATMNAPVGVNGMWNTSLLVPGLLMAPVTLFAGPMAAYNLLFVAGLAAGPVCAFPLFRRFVRSDFAAAAGAMLFGFCPAVLASGLGHINLVLIGLIPLMLMVVYDLAAGRRNVLTGGVALGLMAAAQLFTSEELLLQAGLITAVGFAWLIVTEPRAVTIAALSRVARGFGVGLGVFLVICSGPLWLQFWGPLRQHGNPFTVSYFEADLRGFYTPSHMFWLSTRGSSAFAAAYGGGPPEYMAYLGVPLLLAAVAVGVARFSDRHAPLLLGIGIVFAVFSLGGTLLSDGRQTGVHLPWGVVKNWPILGSALPDRFALVVDLAAAGLLALGLDWLLASRRAAVRMAGLALAAACVVPLVPRPYATMAADPVPSFFQVVNRWVPARSTILVLPYPTATNTPPMVWQAASDMAFQMPGGYFIGPAGDGQAYIGGPGPTPMAQMLIQIGQGAAPAAVTPALRAQFSQAMTYWGADAIVIGPGANSALAGFMQRMVGQPPRRVGGVLLWRS
jgi:hypothetical protein